MKIGGFDITLEEEYAILIFLEQRGSLLEKEHSIKLIHILDPNEEKYNKF